MYGSLQRRLALCAGLTTILTAAIAGGGMGAEPGLADAPPAACVTTGVVLPTGAIGEMITHANNSGDCTWTAPAGTVSVSFIAAGAGGGKAYNSAPNEPGGGGGGVVELDDIPASAGDPFLIEPGGQGQNGNAPNVDPECPTPGGGGSGGFATGGPGGAGGQTCSESGNSAFGGSGGGGGGSFVWEEAGGVGVNLYVAAGGGGGGAAGVRGGLGGTVLSTTGGYGIGGAGAPGGDTGGAGGGGGGGGATGGAGGTAGGDGGPGGGGSNYYNTAVGTGTSTQGNDFPSYGYVIVSATVQGPPSFTGTDHFGATIGVPFGVAITTAGSPAPTITSSALPDGLSLETTCNGTTAPAGDTYICGAPQPGAAGVHSITLTASNGFTPDATMVFTLSISAAQTITTLAGPTTLPTYGAPLALTATVSPPPLSDPATVSDGTVNFVQVDGTMVTPVDGCFGASAVAVSGGAATCTIAGGALDQGLHTFQAIYSGSDNYVTSTSDALPLTIGPATTTTEVSSSANPAFYGQPLAFTATVTANAPGAVNPTDQGTVTFLNGGTPACSNVALNAGQAECTEAAGALAASPTAYDVTAVFTPGSLDYLGSASSALSQVVAAAETTTTVTSSASPANIGEQITFTASVTANAPSIINPDADGTVAFSDTTTGATLCPAVPLAGGIATCATSFTAGGTNAISAAYSGAPNYEPSEGSFNEAIDIPTVTTVVATVVNNAPAPSITIEATVTSAASGTVGEGTVTFSDGVTVLCGAVPLRDSKAACTTPLVLATGSPHNLTATYSGHGFYLPSSAAAGAVAHLARPTLVTIELLAGAPAPTWVITGGGFSGATSVTVCGIAVPFTVVSDNTLLVSVPPIPGPKQCTVVVVAAGGTGSSPWMVTIVPTPAPGAPLTVIPTGTDAAGDGPSCVSLALSGQWTLIAWPGASGTPVAEALSGAADGCADNMGARIGVIWAFDSATQSYEAYFPGINVPGANDLVALTRGMGYWVALIDPAAGPVTWTTAAA